MNNIYSKGSEWRKWDLHIHTPKSIVQEYGGDNENAWNSFMDVLANLPSNIKAIAITDYLFIDGYKNILTRREEISNIELIIPGIEFRLNTFSGTEHNTKRHNFHVLFNPAVSVNDIKEQLLNCLSSGYIIRDGSEWQRTPTRRSLEELGQSIKQAAPKKNSIHSKSDLQVGFDNITYKREDIIKNLEKDCFKGKYLTYVGYSEWNQSRWDQSAAEKRNLINQSDFAITCLDDISKINEQIENLKSNKLNSLVLHSSDAHSLERLGKTHLWIKADLTFEGLKQITKEPVKRVFIGEKPSILERISKSPSKYIKTFFINKKRETNIEEKWFENIKLNLNPEMIAIIGNKGNGKSALSDSIGLVGNTPNYDSFSFLNKDKFRRKKDGNKSKHFIGKIEWVSGDFDERGLNENPVETDVEKVKYIPQDYFEKLCNQEDELFEQELARVIYKQIDNKYETDNLEDLIEFLSNPRLEKIETLKIKINEINREIIDLEGLTTETKKEEILKTLHEKKRDIDSLKEPIPVKKPDDKSPELLKIIERVERLRGQRKKLQEEKEKAEKQKTAIGLKKKKIENIFQKIENFKNYYAGFIADLDTDLVDSNIEEIKGKDIIALEIKNQKLNEAYSLYKNKYDEIINKLDTQNENSIAVKIINIDIEIKKLTDELDAPSKQYQKYLKEKQEWEEKINTLLGYENQPGTYKYYKKQLLYIKDDLDKDLDDKYRKRKEIVDQIYIVKEELKSIMKALFKPVSTYISENEDLNKEYPINLDVSFKLNDFEDNFFEMIYQHKIGSFREVEPGRERLRNIIESYEVNDKASFFRMIDEIISNLKMDKREGRGDKEIFIHTQIQGEVIKFYNYLFSLEYLTPFYEMKLADKSISELSPGEKGYILLIFYLFVDTDDIPLIIDQPEVNLDNQSVFELLLPCIKKAKERRQIIIVTHNPNLAVVCDAEQIIYAKIDKLKKCKVAYFSGSIENPVINEKIVAVLEGTLPAFNNRDAKYEVARMEALKRK